MGDFQMSKTDSRGDRKTQTDSEGKAGRGNENVLLKMTGGAEHLQVSSM